MTIEISPKGYYSMRKARVLTFRNELASCWPCLHQLALRVKHPSGLKQLHLHLLQQKQKHLNHPSRANKDNLRERIVSHNGKAGRWRSLPQISCLQDARNGNQGECNRHRNDKEHLLDANRDRRD